MTFAINALTANDLTILNKKMYIPNINDIVIKENNIFAKANGLSLENKEVNKQNLQEIAQFVSLVQSNAQNGDASDKSTLEILGGKLGQELFHRIIYQEGSLLTKLTKANPYMIIASLLGLEFEEDGNAFKNGAITGQGGDFEKSFSEYFSKMWENAKTGYGKAFLEGLNMIPNLGSILLTNALKYAGSGIAEIFGKDAAAFIGSLLSGAGRGINAIGETIVNMGKTLWGTAKSLVHWDFDELYKTALDALNGYEKIFNSLKDKVVEIGTDCKDFFVGIGLKFVKGADNVINKIGDGIKTGFNKVVDFFSDLF